VKILLLGGSGQLGFEIQKRAHDLNFDLISPVLSELDIGDVDQLLFLARRIKPTLILNCAAYTNVDGAEAHREEAFRVNSTGARNSAIAAKETGCRLIHISTDYVFDGTATSPIAETALAAPINVYGESKLGGEQAVLEVLGPKGLVVRTSSLHGQKGVNFVHTMIELFKTRDVVKVVSDQTMSPTWAGWLAEVLLDLGRIEYGGVVHACGQGAVSWLGFAQEILTQVKPKINTRVKLEPISAQEFARPARRPAYSVLDCASLTKVLGRKPITWQVGLKGHLAELDLG